MRLYRNDEIMAFSAGIQPARKVSPQAITQMERIGYEGMKLHTTKSIHDVPDFNYDYVITIGVQAYISNISADRRLEWRFSDGEEMDEVQLMRLRDKLLNKVLNLVISVAV